MAQLSNGDPLTRGPKPPLEVPWSDAHNHWGVFYLEPEPHIMCSSCRCQDPTANCVGEEFRMDRHSLAMVAGDDHDEPLKDAAERKLGTRDTADVIFQGADDVESDCRLAHRVP